MATITITTIINDIDLFAIAKIHGYTETIDVDNNGKKETITNPQTFQEYTANFLLNKTLLQFEHEITYPQVNNLSPNNFSLLKEATIADLKSKSTITF